MDMLLRGVLKDGTAFYVRELHSEDLMDVLHVQQGVVGALENDSTLATLSKEEFSYILSGNGSLVGVFADDRLIAFRATLVPVIDEEHLGLDIGLGVSELPFVLYQEISNVSTLYRGNGFQRIMAGVLMAQWQAGDFKYICATVAPFNMASLKDKFSQKMEIAALKEKYGGKLRYVFVKKSHEDHKEYEAEQLIPMDDVVSQQKVLSDGWRGTGMVEGLNGWIVRYQK